MAQTNMNGTSVFDLKELLNSLTSELAPLIALFGEQATRQFLSLSLDWGDHLLLATCPLGIITIPVTAIRIAGPAWLRVFIGRAREERSLVERETQSSTSENVCELWTGHGVVRTKGQLPQGAMTTLFVTDTKILTAGSEAVRRYYGDTKDTGNDRAKEAIEWIDEAPPNLTLDLRDARDLKLETRLFAVVGIGLQVVVITVVGLVTFVWQPESWSEPGFKQQPSLPGFLCYLLGKLVVFFSMLMDGYIIDASIVERTFKCTDTEARENILVARLQRACTVGEQRFQPYVVFNPLDNPDIRHSTPVPNPKIHEWLVSGSSIVAVGGLFFQVGGLHFLHPLIIWLELGSMLVLTLIRAYVRRGLAPHPPHFSIDTQELASLCLTLALPESFDAGKPLAPVKLIKSLKPWCPTIHSQWELITGRLPLLESGAGPLESPVQWIEQWEQKDLLLSSIKRSAKRSSEAYHHDQEVRDASEVPEIEFFTSAVSQDRTLLPAEVARVGNRLARAIEGVIMYMRSAGGDDVR